MNIENKVIIKEMAINYIENSPWFTNFYNNFKKIYNSTSIETYFDKTPPRCYINSAFIWFSSPEKSEFWETVNKDYLKFLDQTRRKIN